VEDCGFKGQTKDFTIGTFVFAVSLLSMQH
jgi:hypothetical protein